MRSSSKIPKHDLAIKSREERQHERTGRSIMCAIWTGLLPGGEKSPGVVSTTKTERRPYAWVVPIRVLNERNRRGMIDLIVPGDGPESEKQWARQHVRKVFVDLKGYSPAEIKRKFLIKVPYPFWTASSGEIVYKAGRSVSLGAVPDGQTASEEARNKLLDSSLDILERTRLARARYGTKSNPTKVVPYSGSEEQFPRDGEVWIGG